MAKSTTAYPKSEKANDVLPHLPHRRVWVKQKGGTPTAIMITQNYLVDDLKSAVHDKFPLSLAKYCDLPDLRLSLSSNSSEATPKTRMMKKKVHVDRIKMDLTEDVTTGLPKKKLNTTTQDMRMYLEPDRNVWDIVDDFFGGEMLMVDAFLIEVEVHRQRIDEDAYEERHRYTESSVLPLLGLNLSSNTQNQWMKQTSVSANSNLQTPRPQYPTHNPHARNPSVDKLQSASPNSSFRQSPVVQQNAKLHKRSQSNPSQSPVSLTHHSRGSNLQAVLLLPKNFSLNDQQLFRSSISEETTPKPFVESRTGPRQDERTPIPEASTLEDEGASRNITKKESNNFKDGLVEDDHLKIVAKKDDSKPRRSSEAPSEKTINTSTFEKVLPLISVLVVEDNSINQAILGAFLRKHKIHYQIAKNGQEAVDKWRKGGFHLVLMDIQLPVKSGIDATKEIRHLEKINRIGVFAQHEISGGSSASEAELNDYQKLDLTLFRSPVIIVALTASSNSSVDRKNALTAGCNDFLTKPVNLVWLQNKITEWGCMQALIDFDGWKVKSI